MGRSVDRAGHLRRRRLTDVAGCDVMARGHARCGVEARRDSLADGAISPAQDIEERCPQRPGDVRRLRHVRGHGQRARRRPSRRRSGHRSRGRRRPGQGVRPAGPDRRLKRVWRELGTVPISRNSGQTVIPATAGISQTSSRLSLNDRPARGLRWEIPASAGMTWGRGVSSVALGDPGVRRDDVQHPAALSERGLGARRRGTAGRPRTVHRALSTTGAIRPD